MFRKPDLSKPQKIELKQLSSTLVNNLVDNLKVKNSKVRWEYRRDQITAWKLHKRMNDEYNKTIGN